MIDILLVGGGGHCKSVIDSIKSMRRFNIVGILDSYDRLGEIINEVEIVGTDKEAIKFFEKGCQNVFVTLGSIGNTNIRQKIYFDMKKIGFKFPIIIDETAIVSHSAKIGYGTFVGKGAIINCNTDIGHNCIINSGCIIEHDCTIGNFVHISPGCTLSGGVSVMEGSHIGTNSTVIQYKNIGSNSIIGAGSVVIRDISSNKKAYGNPCKEVENG